MLAILLCLAAKPELPAEFVPWRICYVQHGDLWTCDGWGRGAKLVVREGRRPCWSPDHTRIAFARGHDLWVVDSDGLRPKRVFQGEGTKNYIDGISWGKGVWPFRVGSRKEQRDRTPDQSILFALDRRLYTIPVRKGDFGKVESFIEVQGPGSWLQAPAVGADGKCVAASIDGDVWMAWVDQPVTFDQILAQPVGWNCTRVAALARYDSPVFRGNRAMLYVSELSWSPDGEMLAYGRRSIGDFVNGDIGFLRIRLTANPAEVQDRTQIVKLADHALYPSFSPDSKWILAKVMWGGLVAFSVDGKRRLKIFEDEVDEACW